MSKSTVVVVAGVAGSGKSTLSAALVERLGWDFAEADMFHPAANIAKMTAGQPLNDDDRRPWLATLAAWIDEHIAAGQPAILTCSALTRAYRDVLRRTDVVFVQLTGPRDLLEQRITSRQGHFFVGTGMLDSQLATFEPLHSDEQGFVVSIDQPTYTQVETILTHLP
ncbi:MAG: gluconokinase [Cellulomonadaceae bacterium]|nr:gluconokinase [Cellulomonadaceae bacterium]